MRASSRGFDDLEGGRGHCEASKVGFAKVGSPLSSGWLVWIQSSPNLGSADEAVKSLVAGVNHGQTWAEPTDLGGAAKNREQSPP